MGSRRHLALGALAGAAGTAAMDVLLYRRYRREGGTDAAWQWESAERVTGWDTASAPGRLTQKVARLVTGRPPSDRWARPATNLVHWATGAGWGVQFALLAGRTSNHRWLPALALGPAAWLTSYIVLPLAMVYEPIWEYDARTLGKDLSAHLVYGSATGLAFSALTRVAHR